VSLGNFQSAYGDGCFEQSDELGAPAEQQLPGLPIECPDVINSPDDIGKCGPYIHRNMQNNREIVKPITDTLEKWRKSTNLDALKNATEKTGQPIGGCGEAPVPAPVPTPTPSQSGGLVTNPVEQGGGQSSNCSEKAASLGLAPWVNRGKCGDTPCEAPDGSSHSTCSGVTPPVCGSGSKSGDAHVVDAAGHHKCGDTPCEAPDGSSHSTCSGLTSPKAVAPQVTTTSPKAVAPQVTTTSPKAVAPKTTTPSSKAETATAACPVNQHWDKASKKCVPG
jgi:hypothetical protein